MKIFIALISLLSMVNAGAQEFDSSFKIIVVNKKVREFPDRFDLSSPLNSFVTVKYLLINGKEGMFGKVSAVSKKSLLPDSTAADSQVPDNMKEFQLNTVIENIIVYSDSIAFVVSKLSQEDGEQFYSVRQFHPEFGKWVNNGEDLFHDVEGANKFIQHNARYIYRDFQAKRPDYQKWIQRLVEAGDYSPAVGVHLIVFQ